MHLWLKKTDDNMYIKLEWWEAARDRDKDTETQRRRNPMAHCCI